MGYTIKPSKQTKAILERLNKYPFWEVGGKTAQSLSRNKVIRDLSSRKLIYIQKGTVGIPHRTTLKKKGNFYEFEF